MRRSQQGHGVMHRCVGRPPIPVPLHIRLRPPPPCPPPNSPQNRRGYLGEEGGFGTRSGGYIFNRYYLAGMRGIWSTFTFHHQGDVIPLIILGNFYNDVPDGHLGQQAQVATVYLLTLGVLEKNLQSAGSQGGLRSRCLTINTQVEYVMPRLAGREGGLTSLNANSVHSFLSFCVEYSSRPLPSAAPVNAGNPRYFVSAG